MKILVSACLLGLACRYDGVSKPNEAVQALAEKHTLIPFCPEIYGGLATPRAPAEIVGDKVINRNGEDVTAQYRKGAAEAVSLAKKLGCEAAILQDKSPSCGKGRIYDGTFTCTLRSGDGIACRALTEAGIRVYAASEITEL